MEGKVVRDTVVQPLDEEVVPVLEDVPTPNPNVVNESLIDAGARRVQEIFCELSRKDDDIESDYYSDEYDNEDELAAYKAFKDIISDFS